MFLGTGWSIEICKLRIHWRIYTWSDAEAGGFGRIRLLSWHVRTYYCSCHILCHAKRNNQFFMSHFIFVRSIFQQL